MKKEQQENALKQAPKKTKRSNTSIPPVSPPSDSESLQESDDEEGVQSHEISNDKSVRFVLVYIKMICHL